MILSWILFILTMLGCAGSGLFYLSATRTARRVHARLDGLEAMEKDWEDTAMAEAQRLRVENAALKEAIARLRGVEPGRPLVDIGAFRKLAEESADHHALTYALLGALEELELRRGPQSGAAE